MISHHKLQSLVSQLPVLVSVGVVQGLVLSVVRHVLVVTPAIPITGLPVASRHYQQIVNKEKTF